MQANKRVENATSTSKYHCGRNNERGQEKMTSKTPLLKTRRAQAKNVAKRTKRRRENCRKRKKNIEKKQDDVAGQIEGLDEPYKANRFCGDNNAKRVLKRLY